ncbi:hypothetical protein SEVIR_1G244250v4 [Setaria viridis]
MLCLVHEWSKSSSTLRQAEKLLLRFWLQCKEPTGNTKKCIQTWNIHLQCVRHGGLRVNTLTLFVLVLRTGIDRATTIAVDDALAWLAADMAVQSPGNAFAGKARPKAAARRSQGVARPSHFVSRIAPRMHCRSEQLLSLTSGAKQRRDSGVLEASGSRPDRRWPSQTASDPHPGRICHPSSSILKSISIREC